MRYFRKITFLIFLLFSGCYPYYEGERGQHAELPEHYIIAVKLWQSSYDSVSGDTLFKPVYGWKYLETDSAIVVSDKVFIPAPGIYKIKVESKWQNANPSLYIITDIANWNSFVKFQIHEGGENTFEQYLNLQEPVYKLRLGVTNGFTPEIEDPSILKTSR